MRKQRMMRPALVLLTLALGACDLEVVNPAAITEDDLNDPTTFAAQVRGLGAGFASGTASRLGGIYVLGSLLSGELVHSGRRPGFRTFGNGISSDEPMEVDSVWAEMSRTRFVAEGVEARISASLPSLLDSAGSPRPNVSLLVQAALWAGLSNRALGDHFCEAVIDGGPSQPVRAYYDRAEAHLTRAIEVATLSGDTLISAAYGARAQTRAMVGNWAGAVEDAGKVETLRSFTQRHIATAAADLRQYNAYRVYGRDTAELTVWGSTVHSLGRRTGTTTGDARVTFDSAAAGQPALGTDGRRRFLRQTKYAATNLTDPIAVVRGTEMRLLEAEAALRAGDVSGAVAKINEVRTFRRTAANPLPDVSATTSDEAWTLLMREYAIELWMEGRWIAGLRRWAASPGAPLVNAAFRTVREPGAGGPDTDARRGVLEVQGGMCLPISRTERFANPNF